MSILFLGPGIEKDSHLWMRRMLSGLGEDVVSAGDTVGAPFEVTGNWRRIRIERNPRSYAKRALRKLRLYDPMRAIHHTLRRAICEDDVDLVFVHFLTEAVRYANLWNETKKPVLVHCHGYDVTWDMRDATDPAKQIHSDDYIKQAGELPSNVFFIANSRLTQDKLIERGIAKKRIHFKPLGTELPPDCNRDKASDEGPASFLYLGRLVDFKGSDLTIAAFETACRRGLKGNLTIAGDGPLRAACELMRARSPYADRIAILGSVSREEGAELRSRADIFTAHSCLGPVSRQEEAFGVAFLEALAWRLPVATGAHGGFLEFVRDGQTGLLFEPGDVEGHAQALLRLEQDPALRTSLGSRGRELVSAQYTLEHEIARLREIIEQVKRTT